MVGMETDFETELTLEDNFSARRCFSSPDVREKPFCPSTALRVAKSFGKAAGTWITRKPKPFASSFDKLRIEIEIDFCY